MSDSGEFEKFKNDWREEWSEDKWEKYFQQEDEQKRRLEELIDKYGFSEQGLRKAFEELGYHIPDENEIPDEPGKEQDDQKDIDELLDSEYSAYNPDIASYNHFEKAHPIFRNCYHLVLSIMKRLRHVDVDFKEHPIVIFQSGLFECMSKLIRAGYDDIDYNMDAERGLILAALKRARKALYLSLLTIPNLNEMKILSQTTQNLFRNEITDLLKMINQEILIYKKNN